MSEASIAPQAINRPAITACIILAVIMQALDTTIANVALPYMQGSVSASADQINWVLTSYIVAAAIMTPPSGFLSNRFGRKRVLLTAIAGFVIASMLCGFSQSLVEIVGFRLLQGFFGAASGGADQARGKPLLVIEENLQKMFGGELLVVGAQGQPLRGLDESARPLGEFLGVHIVLSWHLDLPPDGARFQVRQFG